MKKLIPALCMLLIAAALLGTSTFAWFSMNTEVTAQGMTVNAVADASLVIKTGNGAFGAIAEASASDPDMKPCTSSDGVNFAVLGGDVAVKAPGSSVATWSGTSGAFKDGDLVGLSSTENYVVNVSYKIKSVGAATSNLYVKDIDITVQDSEADENSEAINNMKASIRVAITMGTTTKVFAPDTSADKTSQVGKYTAAQEGDTAKWTLVNSSYETIGTTSLGSLAADAEADLTIKIWFEGQDASCKSDNVSADNISISVVFSKNSTSA